MAYEIWETCMLVPGVNRSNCSGWVQAWGSIIGLAIAIGVPISLRAAELKAKHAAELAAANVVGSALLLMIGPIVGCIAAVLQDIDGYKNHSNPPFLDLRRLLVMVQGLHLPNEWQMLQISPFKPSTATALARGTHLLQQGRSALQLVNQQANTDDIARSKLVADLADVFRKSAEQFERARDDLEEFFTSIEGPDTGERPPEA